MTMNRIVLSLASGLAVAMSGPAAGAAPNDIKVVSKRISDIPSERVHYADLDLATANGLKRLNVRVGAAVSRVCQTSSYRDAMAAKCSSYAWDGAKPQIERAALRAQQIASTGFSAIAPVAIVIALPA
jgi:UrcA family protein